MAEFNNDASDVTESDILSAFGMSDDTSVEDTPAADEAPNTDTDPVGSSEEGSNDTPPAEDHPAQPEPPAQQQSYPDNRQNQAFARMRTENAAMQKTIAKMAQVLGVDPKLSPDQLSEQLNAKATAALAKQQGIDPQLASRLEHLEEINNRYLYQQAQTRAEEQLREIKDRFGASNDDIRTFVDQAIASGYDSYNEKNSLVDLFIRNNFKAILQRERDAAVKAEQARSSKAGDASQPGKKSAPAENKEEKTIDSVSELESLFGELT